MDFRPRMKPRWLSSTAKACLKELMAGFNSAHPLASSTCSDTRLHLSDTAVWLTATLHRLAVTSSLLGSKPDLPSPPPAKDCMAAAPTLHSCSLQCMESMLPPMLCLKSTRSCSACSHFCEHNSAPSNKCANQAFQSYEPDAGTACLTGNFTGISYHADQVGIGALGDDVA